MLGIRHGARAATVSSKVTGKVTEVLIEEGMKSRKDNSREARRHEYQTSLSLAQAQLESPRPRRRDACARKEAGRGLQRQDRLAEK